MTQPKRDRNKVQRRILIVDDHPIVRQGLSLLIRGEPDLAICGDAQTAHEALLTVAEKKPDMVILDLTLKESSGLDLLKDLRIRYPHLPVLILSMHDQSVYAERALRAGARGYLMKDQATEKVIVAIRRILGGDVYLDDSVSQSILLKVASGGAVKGGSPVDCLSDRELEVFRLIGEGVGTREIAARLHRSVKTIDAHRENIKRKLNLNSATDLLKHAIQWVQSEKA